MNNQNESPEDESTEGFGFFGNLIFCSVSLAVWVVIGSFIWHGCTSPGTTSVKDDNLPSEFAGWSCEALKYHSKIRQYNKNGCNK
jgi:hypothetical protein